MGPKSSIRHAVELLEARGFRFTGSSRGRNNTLSQYLIMPGTGLRIRVSDHRWPSKSKLRTQYPDVLTTILVKREQMTKLEVAKRVEDGVRAFEEIRRRRYIEATSTNPEDMPWRFSANSGSAVVEATTLCSGNDAATVPCPNPSV